MWPHSVLRHLQYPLVRRQLADSPKFITMTRHLQCNIIGLLHMSRIMGEYHYRSKQFEVFAVLKSGGLNFILIDLQGQFRPNYLFPGENRTLNIATALTCVHFNKCQKAKSNSSPKVLSTIRPSIRKAFQLPGSIFSARPCSFSGSDTA